MRNLLDFLYKYAHVFFFFLLLSICLVLIIVNNNYHQYVFLSSSNHISGTVNEHKENIIQYMSLRSENEKLLNENERLRNTLEHYKKDNVISLESPQFRYISARVIGATKNLTKNYLTLNKGKQDGIDSDMGVVSADGVVGITNVASSNFAIVLPLINTVSRLSVKIQKNDHFGSLSWNGKNVNYAQLSDIPGYVELEVGDSIVTTGFSAFFSEGIPVGEIVSFKKDKATEFYNIEVKLFTDFNKINNVYVIKNELKEEKLEIEKNINDY